MQKTTRSKAWNRLARIAALGAGALALAGCMADYAYVQPNVAGSGGYYTSEEPGYYDYYGTGPYYPGTGGWGYYNGTAPWSNAFGWDGPGYAGYGYWPSFTFNLGISNVWDFPVYWGPWYSINFPIRGCWRRDCRHHRWNGHHHHDRHDPVASSSPRPWLEPDHPRVSRLAHDYSTPPVEVQAHSVERLANRRPLESASFAPHAFARAPVTPAARERFIGIPASPAYPPRLPAEPVFANQRAMPMSTPMVAPHAAFAVPRPAFRPAPGPAPVSPPPAPHGNASDARIKIP